MNSLEWGEPEQPLPRCGADVTGSDRHEAHGSMRPPDLTTAIRELTAAAKRARLAGALSPEAQRALDALIDTLKEKLGEEVDPP